MGIQSIRLVANVRLSILDPPARADLPSARRGEIGVAQRVAAGAVPSTRSIAWRSQSSSLGKSA